MNKKDDPDKLVSEVRIYLTEFEKGILTEMAEDLDRSRSRIMRYALDELFYRWKEARSRDLPFHCWLITGGTIKDAVAFAPIDPTDDVAKDPWPANQFWGLEFEQERLAKGHWHKKTNGAL